MDKKGFYKMVFGVFIGKIPYILLSYIIYPFIQRTKVRAKYYSENASWYTRQLWLMLNDDEIEKHGVDYDVEMVKEKKPHYNIDTKWGRFKASYWFNVLRNPAYNYSLYNYPVKWDVNRYRLLEEEIDELEKNGEAVSPMVFASWDEGILEEGKAWYNPTLETDLVYCRHSFARERKILFWTVKEEFQFGDFGDRFDIKYKWK